MYILLLMLCSCSFSSRRAAALRTVAEADSLDRVGMLFTDTLRLQEAGDVLNSFLDRTEKAKALYYSGRNYSMQNEDARAVDYYISADRLRPQDAQLRGRLNGNMAYICAQQKKDSLAVIFDSIAANYFLIAKDTIRYSNTLLSISYSYSSLKSFQESDSVWKMAVEINKNPVFLIKAYKYRARYYNNMHIPDSAIICLNRAVLDPDKTFLYWQYAVSHYYLGNTDSSAYYSEKILRVSSNAGHIMDAYFFLGQKAEKDNDIKKVAYYADKRNDWEYIARKNNNQRVLAISKIEDYLLHPRNPITLADKLLIVLASFLIVLFSVIVFFVRRKSRRTIIRQENVLKEKDRIIDQQIQYEKDRIGERKQVVEDNIAYLRESLSASSFAQKNETALFQEVNSNLFQLIDKLESKKCLSAVELKFCIAVLLYSDYSIISEYMNCARSGISKTKKRIAAKLGTTGANLHDLLIEIALH